MDQHKYVISSTPHIRSNDSVQHIMRDVLIALLPATIMGIYFFGVPAAIVIAVSIISCVGFEYLFSKVTGTKSTVTDLSAVVTGLLLAMNMPAYVAWWVPFVGGFVAIVLVKQLFGGLGQNFMNPALASRAFLLAAYPTQMTKWHQVIDATSQATPLGAMKEAIGKIPAPAASDYINALVGHIGGCIGETSVIAILIGAGYLFYKKIISWHTPVAYIGSTIVLAYVFGRNGLFTGFPLYEILLGGLMLGAFFMATDYSSSPITPKGKIIMGIGCSVLTVIIRVYGGYPEGVSYSILLMNLGVPLIDRFTRPKVFGVKEVKKRG